MSISGILFQVPSSNTQFFFLFQAFLNDTGGGERFRTLTSNFYRNADAAILMYSVEDRYTFENLQEWIENAQDCIEYDTFVWAMIGNKSDRPLEIEHDSIRARSEQLQTTLSFFTSAKTGENVVPAFEKIVEEVHKQRGSSKPVTTLKKESVKVHQQTGGRRSCCK